MLEPSVGVGNGNKGVLEPSMGVGNGNKGVLEPSVLSLLTVC